MLKKRYKKQFFENPWKDSKICEKTHQTCCFLIPQKKWFQHHKEERKVQKFTKKKRRKNFACVVKKAKKIRHQCTQNKLKRTRKIFEASELVWWRKIQNMTNNNFRHSNPAWFDIFRNYIAPILTQNEKNLISDHLWCVTMTPRGFLYEISLSVCNATNTTKRAPSLLAHLTTSQSTPNGWNDKRQKRIAWILSIF